MKCQSADFNIEVLCSRINNKELDLQPNFQRGEVWKLSKKQKLIDSILREWRIPPIHVILTEEYRSEVLDGQQRLVAIRDFMNNEFAIDGTFPPLNNTISDLDGLFYKDLSDTMQRKIRNYNLTVITLMEYNPQEPAELFFRLNQPTTLTSAEKRNAFIGKPRDQVKKLSEKFEKAGANRTILGFANSRMAYDEIISKLCYAIENSNISKKITSEQIESLYRNNTPFSSETIAQVEIILDKLLNSIKNLSVYNITFSKAVLFSWFIFIKKNIKIEEKDLSKIIENFELSRKYIKGTQGLKELFIYSYKENLDKYPFYEVMFNIFNQKASMGSTDGSSIVLRDIIIEIFFRIFKKDQNDFLQKVIKLSEENQSFLSVLDKIIVEYSWGEKI